MSTTVNGFNLSGIIATAEEPKGERRDVGNLDAAVDGTTRITRQARKRDLSFKTVPLTSAQAMTWESFLIGEGETFSYDVSTYGSKGSSPSASSGITIGTTSPTPKFGAGNLRVGATTGTITYSGAAANIFGKSTDWTVLVWRFESSAWHHYAVRSDGAKWFDGVRADGTSTPWLTVSSGNVTIVNTTGAAVNYDDLVTLPFKADDAWPPIVGVSASAFSPLPYLDLAGDFVPEQSSRRVLGEVTDAIVKVAGSFRHKLEVKLTAR